MAFPRQHNISAMSIRDIDIHLTDRNPDEDIPKTGTIRVQVRMSDNSERVITVDSRQHLPGPLLQQISNVMDAVRAVANSEILPEA